MPGSTARGVIGPVNVIVHPVVTAITQRRVYIGWSRLTLAEHSKVSAATIERLERGRHLGIGMDRLLRILDALDLELSAVLREAPQ